MKYVIQISIAIVLVMGFALPAQAYFELDFDQESLVLVVFNENDNEVLIDLGIRATVLAQEPGTVLAPANAVYIETPDGKSDQFGPSVRTWSNLQVACITTDFWGTHHLFGTKSAEAPEVRTSLTSQFNGAAYDIIHTLGQNNSNGTNVAIYSADDNQSYAYVMGASGRMNGFNSDVESAYITLDALDSGGSVDLYLYDFNGNGDLIPGSSGDYQAVIRLNADGSVILNPVGGNNPPTIALKQNGADISGTTVSVTEGENLTFTIEAQDEDDTLGLTSPTSSQFKPGMEISDPVATNGTMVWTFTWTPGSDQSGEYPYDFTVSDGEASKTQSLTIQVINANSAPEASVTALDSINEGETFSITVAATDADGSDALSITDAVLPSGATLDSSSGEPGGTYTWVYTWTPDYTQAGTYSLSFTVTDGNSPVPVIKTLTVGNTNQVPVMDEIQVSYTLADPTTKLEFSFSAQDEDQAGLLLAYTPDNLPGTVTVSEPTVDSQTGAHTWTFDWTPGSGVADVYTINFSVTEASGEKPLTSKVSQVVVTVGEDTNAPPVLAAIGSQEVVEGVALLIQMAATDTEGQTLTYSIDYPAAMPADHNAQLDESTGLFTWTPMDGDGDEESYTYDLTFRVADDGEPSQSDEEVVAVTVYANQLPGDPSLNTPEDGGQVNSTQAVGLSVNNASDADTAMGQTLQYHFQLFSESDMATENLLAETDPYLEEEEDGTTEWVTPTTLTLEENQTYYWRCRVYDGIAFSQWVDGSFSVNSGNEAPTAPTRVSPLDDAVLKTLTPELLVQNANDPDGDTLQYVFQIGTSENIESSYGFQSATVNEGNNHSGTGNTSWIVASVLNDNSTYWWRVKAQDSSGSESEWIGPYSFRIDLTDDGPSAPELDTALFDQGIYEGEVTTDTPRLIVGNAADPDADDTLIYFFEIIEDTGSGCGVYEGETLISSPVAGIPEGQMEQPLPGDEDDEDDWDSIVGDSLPQDPDHTAWRTPALNDNTQYCWRAWAEDEQGNVGPAVQSSFFVNLENDTPTACTIKSPVNGSEVSDRRPTLEVNAATDLDGDRISYQFILTDESGVTTYTQTRQGKTSWDVPESLTDGVWYWQVKTFDEHAENGEPYRISEKASFTVDINDLPGKPTIYSPANKQTVTTLLPVLVVTNAEDEDGDALFYEFELYNDPSLANYSFIASTTIVEGTGTTQWNTTAPLTDGMTYYWRVRSFDGEYHSGWTATSIFKVSLSDAMIVNVEASQQILAAATGEQVVEVLVEDSPIYGIRVLVPAGALSENITLTIGYAQNPPDSGMYAVIGKVLEFGPSGTSFLTPVTIEIPYTQEDLDEAGVTAADQLKILNYNEDEETWEEIAITSVDEDNRKIICSVDHFSLYFLGKLENDDNQPDSTGDSSSGGGGGGCFLQALTADATPAKDQQSGAYSAMMLLILASLAPLAVWYRRLRN